MSVCFHSGPTRRPSEDIRPLNERRDSNFCGAIGSRRCYPFDIQALAAREIDTSAAVGVTQRKDVVEASLKRVYIIM